LIKIKNSENRTPLYYSIHTNKEELTDLLLEYTNFKLIKNPCIYLHKAIRMRNPTLVYKLLRYSINPKDTDEQGSNAFHILFSCFNKNSLQCGLIGDILCSKNIPINKLNNESWAPIHIAARRGNKECLEWVSYQNKLLKARGKEAFDINLPGKNNWTPLHLCVNSYRFEETLLLLRSGAVALVKNSDNKSAKQVANGNYLLTKLVKIYEKSDYTKKTNVYFEIEKEMNRAFYSVNNISNSPYNLRGSFTGN